ncbi:MAG: Txe/YoeB family addiction module toxin [Sphingobacteriaceae bacterium]
MEIIYSEEAQKDISFWIKSGNKSIQKKISQLLDAIESNPFEGVGKPEKLKHNFTGLWSRRINQEHRLIYEVLEKQGIIKIHSLKGHYL